MPIEKGGYRKWSGTPSGLYQRIIAIAVNDIRYKIKRPATIVVLVLLGLYTLISGLAPILAGILGGENMFVHDPTPHHSLAVVPEVKVVGAEIMNNDSTVHRQIAFDENMFGVALPPGKTVSYRISVKNTGEETGSLTIILIGGSRSWLDAQWFEDIREINGSGEGGGNTGGRNDGIGGTGNAETPPLGTKTSPPDHPGEDFEDEYRKEPEIEWPGAKYIIEIELSPGVSRLFSLEISLADNASFDTAGYRMIVESKVNEPYWIESPYGRDWATPYSAILNFDLRTDAPDEGWTSKGLFDIGLSGLGVEGREWSDPENEAIFENPPEARWLEKFAFTLDISNPGNSTLYFDIWPMDQELRIRGGVRGDETISVEAGGSASRSFTVRITTEHLPSLRYLKLHVTGSKTDHDLDFYPTTMNTTDRKLVVLPLKIESRQLEVDDETAEYFYNVFYTGGMNIWVILFAVIIGAGMVADDKANKTLPLYYSKAIPRYGYALGKFTGLFAFLFLITAVWSNIWYLSIMILGGFSWDFFISHLWVQGALLVYGTALSAVLTSLVLVASSLTKNRYFAGAVMIALYLILSLVGGLLWGMTRNDNYLLISLSHNYLYLGRMLFDLGSVPVEAGYPIAVLTGVFGVAGLVIYYQLVKREVVVG